MFALSVSRYRLKGLNELYHAESDLSTTILKNAKATKNQRNCSSSKRRPLIIVRTAAAKIAGVSHPPASRIRGVTTWNMHHISLTCAYIENTLSERIPRKSRKFTLGVLQTLNALSICFVQKCVNHSIDGIFKVCLIARKFTAHW